MSGTFTTDFLPPLEFPQTLGVAENAVCQVKILIMTHAVCDFHKVTHYPIMCLGRKTNHTWKGSYAIAGNGAALTLGGLVRGTSLLAITRGIPGLAGLDELNCTSSVTGVRQGQEAQGPQESQPPDRS